ncbi:hypothetical protein D3C73_1221340 [compost metagenome]
MQFKKFDSVLIQDGMGGNKHNTLPVHYVVLRFFAHVGIIGHLDHLRFQGRNHFQKITFYLYIGCEKQDV